MNSLYANTRNELEKIFCKKRNVIFLLIAGLIPIGAGCSFNLLQGRLGIFAINASSFGILMLELFTAIFLPLYIFSVSAEVFSGEMGDRTLKITLTRPITRFNVFLSKLFSILIFIGVNLAIIFILSGLSGMFLDRSGVAGTILLKGLLAYILALLPLFFLSVFSVFLAQFFKNSGGALMAGLLIYIAAKLLPFIFPVIGKISPFAYMDWYMGWLGTTVSLGRQMNIFLLLLSYCLIFFSAGYYFFDKKDL